MRRYIDATHATRRKYLPPRGRGGAAYVDIFAGPGRARIRSSGDIVDGSPLIAIGQQQAPFSDVILCDLDDENIAALRARTGADHRVQLVAGDCNVLIDDIVSRIPPYGLSVALVDPFAPSAMQWSTISRLGRVRRMDLLIHFPTGSIKRNFKTPGFDQTVDQMLGTSGWRGDVRTERDVAGLVRHLRSQLVTLGYDSAQVRDVPIRNTKNAILYHLVFASKNPRGTAIWQSITRIDPSGQRGFDF